MDNKLNRNLETLHVVVKVIKKKKRKTLFIVIEQK